MKTLFLSALLLAFCASSASARKPIEHKEPRVRFGVGYRFSLPLREHIGIDTDILKDGEWVSPYYKRGGELTFEGTVRIDKNWNAGLGVAYGSYDNYLKTFKVYAKAERLYGKRASRWFNYANIGTTLYPDQGAGLAAGLGGGYRLAITRRTRVDFTAGIDYINIVGQAIVQDNGDIYPRGAHINRIGLTFGIAMHF